MRGTIEAVKPQTPSGKSMICVVMSLDDKKKLIGAARMSGRTLSELVREMANRADLIAAMIGPAQPDQKPRC